jgi:hypothetical protein
MHTNYSGSCPLSNQASAHSQPRISSRLGSGVYSPLETQKLYRATSNAHSGSPQLNMMEVLDQYLGVLSSCIVATLSRLCSKPRARDNQRNALNVPSSIEMYEYPSEANVVGTPPTERDLSSTACIAALMAASEIISPPVNVVFVESWHVYAFPACGNTPRRLLTSGDETETAAAATWAGPGETVTMACNLIRTAPPPLWWRKRQTVFQSV